MNESDDRDDASAAMSGSGGSDPSAPPASVDGSATEEGAPVDLDAIERDLDGVATALERLDAGTYWTDEVTGETISDDRLAADPVARRSD